MLQRLHDECGLEVAREGIGDVGLAAREPARDLAFEHAPPVAFGSGCGGRVAAHFRRQVLHVDHLPGRHHGHPVADVLELAHVAGPVLRREELHGCLGEALAFHAQVARALGEEVPRERGNVLAALAHRGQPQADHVQAMEQVVAEEALLHARFQLLVRRRDHTNVGRERHVAADAIELPVGQHPQEACLQILRHIADLVEK